MKVTGLTGLTGLRGLTLDRADKAYIVCKSEIMTDWPNDSTYY